MKNKFFPFTAILLCLVLCSCATRKYGCPNATGMKLATPVERLPA